MTSLKTKTSKSAQLAIFIHVSLLFIHSSLLQDTFAQEKKKWKITLLLILGTVCKTH